MKSTTTPSKKATTKRTNPSVPFDEMRRLMRVYGSIKCLRKRQMSDGAANMKVDSVKRKFYRWFPDLEDRFERDVAGFYRPKFGHEFEMRYRENMRMKDGEATSKKRTNKRKQRLGGMEVAGTASTNLNIDGPSSIVQMESNLKESTTLVLAPPAIVRSRSYQDLTTGEDTDATSTAVDAGPLDNSFTPELRIFDDVEKRFFTPMSTPVLTMSSPPSPPVPLGHEDSHTVPIIQRGLSLSSVQDCPRLTSSSSFSSGGSEDEQRFSSPWETVSPSIDITLDKSMEEYCKEVLASDGEDGGSDFQFDM